MLIPCAYPPPYLSHFPTQACTSLHLPRSWMITLLTPSGGCRTCTVGDRTCNIWWTGRDTYWRSGPGYPNPLSWNPSSSMSSTVPIQTSQAGCLEAPVEKGVLSLSRLELLCISLFFHLLVYPVFSFSLISVCVYGCSTPPQTTCIDHTCSSSTHLI